MLLSATLSYGCELELQSDSSQIQNSTQPNQIQGHKTYQTVYESSVKWLCLNSTPGALDCCKIDFVHCLENGPSLDFAHCATFNGEVLSIAPCGVYFHPIGYNVTKQRYIHVPTDLSELNASMCGPLNRKGLVCSECADGYGPSVTSFGDRCIECSGAWYAVPLFLLLQFVPLTVFYFIILVFRISVTSPPMPCFIMLAQLVVYTVDHHEGRFPLIFNEGGDLRLEIKIMRVFYGIFNLDFLPFVFPPLFLSSKLKFIHITFFGYISAFYPLFLICLTWIYVELHDRNVRLIVLAWRPFHKCFVRLRKGFDRKNDLIDVFITFLILSYSKCWSVANSLFDHERIVEVRDSAIQLSSWKTVADISVAYFGKDHLPVLIVSCFIAFFVNILPSLLLVLYPIRVFRLCLSKCRLNFVSMTIFTDKLLNCYRNSLDGGWDMRSFSGFYFLLRLNFHSFLTVFDKLSTNNKKLSSGITLLSAALLVAVIRPYRRMYMNNVDILLLFFFSMLYFSKFENLLIMRLLLISPVIVLVLSVFLAKVLLQLTRKVKGLFGKCLKFLQLKRSLLLKRISPRSSITTKQPLIQSPPNHFNYGTSAEQ